MRAPTVPGDAADHAPSADEMAASIHLHPGQVVATGEAHRIVTILGSCVTVCLFDQVKRVGGANHFLLPQAGPPGTGAARYAPAAMQQLIERVLAMGADRRRLVAHVVGGATVLAGFRTPAWSLGLRNAEAAREALRLAAIRVVFEDVGGQRGRKLAFRTADGLVSVATL